MLAVFHLERPAEHFAHLLISDILLRESELNTLQFLHSFNILILSALEALLPIEPPKMPLEGGLWPSDPTVSIPLLG